MERMKLQNEAFVTLVNKQLEPFNKTYTDVKSDKYWYTKHVVTPDQETEFINWGSEYLQQKLGLTEKQAQMEMNWFILQWGLKSNKIVNSSQSIEQTEAIINQLKKSK
jgi:hypothetical protein